MTGGHGGLGRIGALTLATQYRCDLILAGRNRQRVEQAAHRLRGQTGAKVEVLMLDLGSLESVRAAAAECKTMLRAGKRTDVGLQSIVCNAGMQTRGAATYSTDGYEETFASNCLGHFLLVNLLLDSIAADGRIIWTSSGTHDPFTTEGRFIGNPVAPDAGSLAHQGRDGKAVSGARRYATSKLCLVLYAYEMDRRMRQAGTSQSSIAYDPGFIPELGLGREAPSVLRSGIAKFVLGKLGMTMGKMPLSGEALAMLALDPAFEGRSGKYFRSKNGTLSEASSSVVSYDLGKAAKLWTDSVDLVKLNQISAIPS